MIPNALDFFNRRASELGIEHMDQLLESQIAEIMQEFTKLHVRAALEKVLELTLETNSAEYDDIFTIIHEAYPDELIR